MPTLIWITFCLQTLRSRGRRTERACPETIRTAVPHFRPALARRLLMKLHHIHELDPPAHPERPNALSGYLKSKADVGNSCVGLAQAT
jgi:hypothetical protein